MFWGGTGWGWGYWVDAIAQQQSKVTKCHKTFDGFHSQNQVLNERLSEHLLAPFYQYLTSLSMHNVMIKMLSFENDLLKIR